MAQNFRRYAEKNIGTTPVDIPDAANFDSFDTIVGINLANRSALAIKASVFIIVNLGVGGVDTSEQYRHYYIKDAPIPTGGTLQVLDGGAKFVVQALDRLYVVSDTASSLDVWVSAVDAIST